MQVNEDMVLSVRNGKVLMTLLRLQGRQPSWDCEFLGDCLYQSIGSGSDGDDVFSEEPEREVFLEYLRIALSEGTIAPDVRNFWYSRICHQPSEEQVQLALRVNNPLLVLETIIRKHVTEFNSDLGLATTSSIQRLSELLGIAVLGELLSSIPIDPPLNTQDLRSDNARVVLKGVREFIRVLTLHGGDQFADKHFQVQFNNTMRFDQCEVSSLTSSRWQLSMSTAVLEVLLMPSRTNWLLVHHWKLISGLIELGQKVRLCLADGADESNVPTDDFVTIAFCGRSDTLDRIILVEDTYSVKARQLLVALPEPLGKDAARALYDRRIDKVFWRGSTTGPIRFEANELADRLLSNQRVRFCLEASLGSKRIDALITNIVQVNGDERNRWVKQLQQWALLGSQVPEEEFLRYRYYIDLDGNSAAWGAVQKYLGLCLVIKPVSQWRVKHHEMLQNGVNFLEISAPKVTEVEKILDRYSPGQLFEIAYSGHLMAHKHLRSLTGEPSKRISFGRRVQTLVLGD